MTFESKFDIGDIVYLKTDPEQYMRIIVEISFTEEGASYSVSHVTDTSYHSECELSLERDIMKTLL